VNAIVLLIGSAVLAQAPPPQSPGDAMRAAIEKQKAAVAVQREAIRKQAESAGARSMPWDPPSLVADAPCDPIADEIVAPILAGAAKAQNVKVDLLRAIIGQESGFRPCAVSSRGAIGLMQLMPSTIEQLDVKDAFDPKENIDAGAKYLKQLMDKYKGDLAQALGAYNAGPGAVDRSGGVPMFPETQDYVKAILQKVGAAPLVTPVTPVTPLAPPQSPTPKPTGN
jgi:soluble lytic murein transglycosylase-like protein